MRTREILQVIRKNLVRPFNKALEVLLPFLLRFLDRLKLHRLIAFILVLAIKLNTILWKLHHFVRFSKKGEYSILAFNREIFERDLIELERRTDLNIIIFPNLLAATFANTFLPKYLRCQVCYHLKNFNNNNSPIVQEAIKGCTSPDYTEIQKIKNSFKKVIEQILPHLIQGLKLNAFLSANVDYYVDREWINACNENKFPFLVLNKENSLVNFETYKIPAGDVDFKVPIYRFAVSSQVGRDSLLQSRFVGEEQIVVTGFPRTDLVFDTYMKIKDAKSIQKKHNHNNEKWIVLFDFTEREEKKLCDETIKIFYKCAEENTDRNIKFIVKTKGVGYTKDMKEFLVKKYGSTSGILVDHNISFADIICKSALLCGFSSLALVKSLFTDIPVVIVRWADGLGYIPDMMFPDDANPAYRVVHSQKEFYNYIQEFVINLRTNNFKIDHPQGFRAEREKIIEKYLFKIDGKRSIEVANFIKKGILDLAPKTREKCSF